MHFFLIMHGCVSDLSPCCAKTCAVATLCMLGVISCVLALGFILVYTNCCAGVNLRHVDWHAVPNCAQTSKQKQWSYLPLLLKVKCHNRTQCVQLSVLLRLLWVIKSVWWCSAKSYLAFIKSWSSLIKHCVDCFVNWTFGTKVRCWVSF